MKSKFSLYFAELQELSLILKFQAVDHVIRNTIYHIRIQNKMPTKYSIISRM